MKRRGYRIGGASGDRVLLVPSRPGAPALVYDRGELTSIGPASSARMDRSAWVSGHVDLPLGSYTPTERQSFEWRSGVRTITGRTLIRWDGDVIAPIEVPEPELGRRASHPIPKAKSFATEPQYDPLLAWMVPVAVRTREADPPYRLVVEGRPTSLIMNRWSNGIYIDAARSRTGLIYGTVITSGSGAYTLYSAKGFVFTQGHCVTLPDHRAHHERNGRVLFLKQGQHPVNGPKLAGAVWSDGRVHPLEPIVDGTIARDGSVRGHYFLSRAGTPMDFHTTDGDPAPFVQEFVWRDGVQTLTRRVPAKGYQRECPLDG